MCGSSGCGRREAVDVLLSRFQILVKQLSPLGPPHGAIPGRIDKQEFSWFCPDSKKIECARSALHSTHVSLREKKKESATRTAFLLVGNNARRPKTALNKLDFPQFARPMTMTWRGPITNQRLGWEMRCTTTHLG